LRPFGLGRCHGVGLLDLLRVHKRLIDPEGTQLILHEIRESGPVALVKLLQRFDLPLQRLTLGGQTPDDIFIALLGLMHKFVGIRLGIFGHLVCPYSSIGQHLFGVPLCVVRMSLGVSGYLCCRSARIGHHLLGFLPENVGVRLGVSGYLLRRCARIRTNRVRFSPSTGDVFLGCSLSQGEHLESLVLGAGPGKSAHLFQGLIHRKRPSEQTFDTTLHPTVSHKTISACGCSYATACVASLPLQ